MCHYPREFFKQRPSEMLVKRPWIVRTDKQPGDMVLSMGKWEVVA